METKHEDRLHARNLYFGTNMSQQEIADQCNINRKTLYLWMNEGGWRHAKYAAAHAPGLLLDQYYEQLGKLNQHIATRENPWPTKDEATTIRKITMSINHFKESTGLGPTMHIFHDFIKYLQLNENKWEMAKEFMLPIDRFVKKMIADKDWLSYNHNTMNNEEQQFQREYAEWLKTQPPAEKEEKQKDVIVSSPNDILSPPKDIPTPANGNHTSLSPGEGRGEAPQPADVIVSSPNDILSPSKDIPTPANGNHTSLSPGEGRGEAPQPADVILSSPNDILSPSKDIPTPASGNHTSLSPGEGRGEAPQPADVILSSSNDILSSPKDIPTPANGNHTSLSPGEGRGEAPQPADVIVSSPNDILSPSKDIPTPANGNHTSLSPGEGRGEAPQPTPENIISTPPKSTPATPKKPIEPQPQTFWQLRQQQESARLGTNPPVKAQPYNPNSQSQTPNSNQQNSNANSAPRAITYTPGTQPNGTPVPHPTQPRHLTNIDIQKMMETPQAGQQPNNFNPKRY